MKKPYYYQPRTPMVRKVSMHDPKATGGTGMLIFSFTAATPERDVINGEIQISVDIYTSGQASNEQRYVLSGDESEFVLTGPNNQKLVFSRHSPEIEDRPSGWEVKVGEKWEFVDLDGASALSFLLSGYQAVLGS